MLRIGYHRNSYFGANTCRLHLLIHKRDRDLSCVPPHVKSFLGETRFLYEFQKKSSLTVFYCWVIGINKLAFHKLDG